MLRLRTFGGLLIEEAGGVRLPNPRPRRLALLALVAAAGPRGITRDRVRAIFWPDADDEQARQALRQTIYALQRDLGVRAIGGGAELRLESETISSDVDDFRSAIAVRDWGQVRALYQGRFAAGFVLPDVPEFERWLEDEQRDLARQAQSVAEMVARAAEAAGDWSTATDACRTVVELDPLSARATLSYMNALVSSGDRSGAIAHARRYAAQVRRELDAEPDPAVARLEADLRSAASRETVGFPPEVARVRESEPVAEPEVAGASEAPVPVRAWAGRRHVAVAAIALAGVATLVAAFASAWPKAERPPIVLAVGEFRDLTTPDSARSRAVMSRVLTTSLARHTGMEVIADSRIVELLEDPVRDTLPAARTDAARRAGANEIVEGEMVAMADGRFRLDLRRVDVARGALRGGYSVSGPDRLALIDTATTLLAAAFDLDRRQPPLEVTPRSPTALRLFDEGLSAYGEAQADMALRLFRAALDEDSTFALAAYYTYRTAYDLSGVDTALEARALRLSMGAADRDRLYIQTAIRGQQNDTASLALADTLASRFPRDAEALRVAANAMVMSRRIDPRSRDLLERAIALDSASVLAGGRCRVCAAIGTLAMGLRWADAATEADAVIRRWRKLLPAEPTFAIGLAYHQFGEGQYEAGIEEIRGLRSPAANRAEASMTFIGRLLTGRLDEADAECQVWLRQEDPRDAGAPRWLCPIVWRSQGRLDDAARLIFSSRLPDGRQLPAAPRDVVNEYLLHFDMDRPRLAKRTLEDVAPRPGPGLAPGMFARELTWNLTRRGTAAAKAGDLETTRRLADSAERVGRASAYGRDRLLHYFLRGLIAQAAGDHETAADFFRRSIFSPTYGYTRANYELAGSLLALGRPAEAVPTLQAALRGGHDGSNLYITRTELHERLAEAFAAAGRQDSAAAHYVLVENAWRRADPAFSSRYRRARDYLRGYRPGLSVQSSR